MAGKRRLIYDNIYGYIDFDKELFDRILHDPFFLRLHNIKQMGLAYYVYPDALHSRYAHSLGVYATVNRIINAQQYCDTQIAISSDDINKIMLSALLHDIGHLPLSHTIEMALKEFDEFENEIDEKSTGMQTSFSQDDIFTENSSISSLDKPVIIPDHMIPKLHEDLGMYVLNASGISDILESKGISSLEIASGFKGDIEYALQNEAKEKSFYYMQIRNFLHSQLDADRIDYLLRDSGFSGLKSGGFDIDKLFTSIVYDDKGHYGIDISSTRALEQFFIARYVAYAQIVGNKKVMAFDYMAKDFYIRLLKMRRRGERCLITPLYSFRDLTEDILKHSEKAPEFLSFTDDYIFTLIREVIAKKELINKIDPIVVKYAEMITNVMPLVPVTYCEILEDNETEPCFISALMHDDALKQRICTRANVNPENMIIPEPLKITLYKDNEDKVQIFGKNLEIICDDISQSTSSIISYLKNKKLKIYRIYSFTRADADKLRDVMTTEAKIYRFRGDL